MVVPAPTLQAQGLRTRRDSGCWGRGDHAGAGATCHHHVQAPQRDEDAGGAISAFHLVAGQILQLLIPLNSYRINGTVLSRKGNVFYAMAAPGRGATHATGTGCCFELAQSRGPVVHANLKTAPAHYGQDIRYHGVNFQPLY